MSLLSRIQQNALYVRNVLRGNWEDDPQTTFANCTPERPPILLLHGFLGTRGALFLLEKRLKNDGYTVFSTDLGVLNTADIRKSAYRIHLEIERILEAADGRIEKIDIVGHSMGGLIGLHYAQAMGGHERVRKLVTLGTPWRGSWFALAGIASPLALISPSTWQMIPGSDFLNRMGSNSVPLYMELASVFGSQDLMCPPATAVHKEAANYLVHIGHAGLTHNMDVYRIIRRILRRSHQPRRDSGWLFELTDGKFTRSKVELATDAWGANSGANGTVEGQ